MRVLLDHCVPRPLAELLSGHEVSTTAMMGWQKESNGRLLTLAAAQFDVFLTVDQNLSRQQNTGELPLLVIVMRCRSNSLDALSPIAPSVRALLDQSLSRRPYTLDQPR